MSCHCLLESASVLRILPSAGGLQSKWPTAALLHELVDVLRLEVVLEERVVEELPLDLGNLDPVPSLRLQLMPGTPGATLGVTLGVVAPFVALAVTPLVRLFVTRGSVMCEIINRGRFRRDILRIRSLLEEARGRGLRDNRGAVVGSRSVVLGLFVAGDGGDALSSEPHRGRSGTVHHLFGVRIDELGVEDASRGEGQFPHESAIGGEGHLANIRGVSWLIPRGACGGRCVERRSH